MDIGQVMQQTAGNYGAKHIFFNQANHAQLWRGNPSGVCLAMCKIWLQIVAKTQTYEVQRISLDLEGSADKIDKKQTRDMAKVKAGKEIKSFQDELGISKMLYKAKDKEVKFWPKAASAMAKLEMRKNLIYLYFGSEPGHAVAACKHGEKVYFFDPNGGVLQFEDAEHYESWLTAEFQKATVDRYHEITLVRVFDYERRPKER